MGHGVGQITVVFACVLTAGCLTGGGGSGAGAGRTQLETRAFQTRNYNTRDFLGVMKAMIDVLQDDRYIVKNADKELGFITATRELDLENSERSFFSRMWGGKDERWTKSTVEECSANVTRVGDYCRVRVNFQVKMLDNFGDVVSIEHVDDPGWYQDFFAKVDKGIFIQREGI